MLSTLDFCKFAAGEGHKEQLADAHYTAWLSCLTHWCCPLSLEAGGLEILLTEL